MPGNVTVSSGAVPEGAAKEEPRLVGVIRCWFHKFPVGPAYYCLLSL